MNYNPAITDRSAEIYSNAANNAAQIQLQGMQSFGQSIGSAMQSLTDGYSKARDNAAKLETSMSAGQAMMNLSQQYGAEGEMFRESFARSLQAAGNNPDKIAGVTAAHTSYFDALMAKDKMKYQYDQSLELARQKQALGGGGGAATGGGSSLTFGFQ